MVGRAPTPRQRSAPLQTQTQHPRFGQLVDRSALQSRQEAIALTGGVGPQEVGRAVDLAAPREAQPSPGLLPVDGGAHQPAPRGLSIGIFTDLGVGGHSARVVEGASVASRAPDRDPGLRLNAGLNPLRRPRDGARREGDGLLDVGPRRLDVTPAVGDPGEHQPRADRPRPVAQHPPGVGDGLVEGPLAELVVGESDA